MLVTELNQFGTGFARFDAQEGAPAFWTAAVLCRFGAAHPAIESSKSGVGLVGREAKNVKELAHSRRLEILQDLAATVVFLIGYCQSQRNPL